jgi:NAD(P)-dependent dehydrogenase (short-subunit alcohol dehydrogenase family)
MKPTSIVIVTGASRGLGRALAAPLLARPDHHVLTIARRPDASLDAVAAASGSTLTRWSLDLADAAGAAPRQAHWLAEQSPADATLINNAATLSTPGPLRDADADDLVAALRVGLEAPLLLTAAFLRTTAGWHGCVRKVLNVSSGLGRRAMAGSASYCAVKAGLDHLTRAVALEEAGRPDGARVVSLAPGVVDTDMQVQLRAADRTRFPDGERVAALKEQGLLDSAESAADKVLKVLERADFGAEPIADVREP